MGTKWKKRCGFCGFVSCLVKGHISFYSIWVRRGGSDRLNRSWHLWQWVPVGSYFGQSWQSREKTFFWSCKQQLPPWLGLPILSTLSRCSILHWLESKKLRKALLDKSKEDYLLVRPQNVVHRVELWEQRTLKIKAKKVRNSLIIVSTR